MNNVDEIAKKYLQITDKSTDIGLLNGRVGQCLFYFLYSSYKGNQIIEDYAEELLYEVTEGITNETPIWFGNGLAGIGWVVAYLFQHQYIEGDVNIIFNCCDRLLTQWDVRRINNLSLEKGLRGIACYVAARLNMGLEHPMLDGQFVNELLERCKQLGVDDQVLHMEKLCEYMKQEGYAPLWKDGICKMIEELHEKESSISN